MRLFLAVHLSPECLQSLEDYQRMWGKELRGWRWVRPQNLHITLKFLGETSPERLSDVEAAVRRAVSSFGLIPVALEGMGAFPAEKNPRVLWVGIVRGGEKLSGLSRALDEACSHLGFRDEGRPFVPHITIARPMAGKRPEGHAGVIARFQSTMFGSFEARSLYLMESQLLPAGPVYEARQEFPLEGKENVP